MSYIVCEICGATHPATTYCKNCEEIAIKRVAEMELDAARYRWLRSSGVTLVFGRATKRSVSLDVIVDTKMQEENKKSK